MTTKDLIHQEHPLWRLLEIAPGLLTWFSFIFPVVLSIYLPALATSFIIIYTITWLFRSLKLSTNLVRSFKLVNKALHTDWENRLTFVDRPDKIDYELEKLRLENTGSLKDKNAILEFEKLQSQLEMLKTNGQYKKSKQIIQAIIYVTYKESYELIRESIKSYTLSKYPLSQMIMVFATEERDQENALAISRKIATEFGHKFMKFIVTVHPKDVPGEIKGKSANTTYAAKQLKIFLDEEKIDYENVIVSNFDADTVVHPLYFSELTFKYLTAEDRTEKAYQPTHMFHNNIWDVPTAVRMVAVSCTFWRMAESMEEEKYKSFSSRSLGFKTVVDVNYWDPAVIPEDSRQYWTAFLIYDGRHKLIPIYCPVYMDAVLSETYVKTFKSQYSQLRRWAWGVCDFPFVALNLWKHPTLPFSKKIHCIFQFLEDSFFWATGPILIAFTGFLPGLVNPGFRDTVLAYNLPHIMSNILTLTSIGIVICTTLSLILIPYHPRRKILGKLSLCIQWFLVPVVSIFLSSIPAIDAQTRLMFGKDLEYKVTQKSRK